MEPLEELSNADLAGRIEAAEITELRRLAWELLRRLRVAEPLARRHLGSDIELEELEADYPRPGEGWWPYWEAVRWPIAEKVELMGAPVWQGGTYGRADVAAIERAFPGWTGVLISEHTLTMRPADPAIAWPPTPSASPVKSGRTNPRRCPPHRG